MNAASINSAKAEGLCQAIFCRSVKNIYDQNKFSKIDVDKWAKEGKIDEHHKSMSIPDQTEPLIPE